MWPYIFKRVLFFIPAFLTISLLAFFISRQSPVDPVDQLVTSPNTDGGLGTGASNTLDQRTEIRRQYGLDQPTFYFTVGTVADCDTLHRIPDMQIRENLDYLTHTYGNWPKISDWHKSLKAAQRGVAEFHGERKKDLTNKELGVLTELSATYLVLMQSGSESYIKKRLRKMEGLIAEHPSLESLVPDLHASRKAHSRMVNESTAWKNYIPSFSWHGFGNQYHQWMFGKQVIGRQRKTGEGGLIRGDFGTSLVNKREISTDMMRKLRISLELTIFAIILAYLISIPIGVFSAYRRDSLFDKGSAIVLFMLYSLPNFFVGLLLLQYFANPEHYEWFNGAGYKSPEVPLDTYYEEWSYLERLQHSWPYMILPLFTYIYAQFAFISRIMRVGMVETLGSQYIVTARAKGLSESQVVLKHALKNALLPIITVFANVFPVAIGGSVIIETIFDYEGMGRELIIAIKSNDYPIVITVFCLAGLLSMIGYLIADVLYAMVDPRIKLSKSANR